ncbi:MAG: PIN domain-containing protein [Thermomicrobiales bacterium]
MIRVVLDTNVLVSELLGSERSIAVPSVILRLWFGNAFRVVVSAFLFSEVERTLGRPFFSGTDLNRAPFAFTQLAENRP